MVALGDSSARRPTQQSSQANHVLPRSVPDPNRGRIMARIGSSGPASSTSWRPFLQYSYFLTMFDNLVSRMSFRKKRPILAQVDTKPSPRPTPPVETPKQEDSVVQAEPISSAPTSIAPSLPPLSDSLSPLPNSPLDSSIDVDHLEFSATRELVLLLSDEEWLSAGNKTPQKDILAFPAFEHLLHEPQTFNPGLQTKHRRGSTLSRRIGSALLSGINKKQQVPDMPQNQSLPRLTTDPKAALKKSRSTPNFVEAERV
ncbi:hypothetical protein PHYBLDRAFT_188463 [Phycomyces blakesleeanus NRRL 1555(-)]|uniref:Uncharacterized protein n=1 Tax=Phycomyces blakesleeanus (strain ATCC 8743b / DSM 1359 / FGSC 10004 / NBRC 33097 / NRRL 1555) TaxID=763407 RepID=A0A167L1N0_PHYB8|nr:hypothetical protein PHYBLDRAFT_188463 [Phycomyces blakesleeanus NRRL 1555(-)]OAD69387.1 hypothetical protein PHYBLDRAFT_188463 [Phycomyces blakesleeanus NRRL 1555(-)]|eukprot:XP_018287427.1 hypothetical protein PHYBLDRAFT_188463 [Phycomyces blakesleeanus NRRL 1555(-)]